MDKMTPEQNAKRVPAPRTDAAIVQAGDCYKTAEVVHADICRILETELIHKQKIIENHCKDWAEDDTAIKELCKRCGVADVHPVGDDFKSCIECVEELAHKFTELRQAADGMRDFADRLEARLESKLSCPDDCQCASRMLLNEYRAYRTASNPSNSPTASRESQG